MGQTYVFERTDRVFVRVFGRDPVKMVQGLITNDIAKVTPAQAIYAGMLTPKGRLVADLRAFRRGDDLILECQVDAVDNLMANIKKFVPPLFAKAELFEQWQMASVHGPAARECVTKVTGAAPTAEDEIVEMNRLLVVGSRYTGDEGFDLIGDLPTRSTAMQQIVAAGAVFGQLDQLERLRIEAGTPRWPTELNENVIPLEAGLQARMISQSKGCYTGQEVIIRILHRGHVNRHLRGVRLGATAAPARDTPLLDAVTGKQMGQITSAVESSKLGETLGLAYVRREVPLRAELRLGTVDGPIARIVELPFEGRL